MPIDGRNRKRELSPTNERPAKRQRVHYNLRNNILAAYAATTSPRKSGRRLVNPDPIAKLGKGSPGSQGVASDEPLAHIEAKLSVSQSTRIVTPHNKRTYGGKGRARADSRGTANESLNTSSNVDDSRGPDTEEGKEGMVEPFFAKGTPRQDVRGKPGAGETHKGAQDEAIVDISHSSESPSDRHSTKSAKNASWRSRRSRHTRGRDSGTAAAREPEDPLVSLINDPSNVNRLPFSSALAVDRRSPTSAQSDPSDGVDGRSTQSVEIPVAYLPKRRGRPKKSRTVRIEDSSAEEPTLAPQPITQEHQRGGKGSNGKGKCVLRLHTRQ